MNEDEKTEFQRLFALFLRDACAKLGISQEEFAHRLGKSRGALIAYQFVKKSCPWSMLVQFAEEAKIGKADFESLKREWVIDRIRFGKHGDAIIMLLEHARRKSTPREFDELLSRMVDVYAKAAED